ncbi:enoyl-CoA hydratase/isomerase family protein [Devosia sp.]|uniref:enoyl-CoA hydratase/isomerase family protein n=1 Tax=Devosia sp. TaxID=1871048 RepID=UPI002AFF361B|nr:enoyl-CoA hydratase/isomerase family protein [Devosia sp.]
MTYTCFRVEIVDAIAIVTFDRPPVNAQNLKSREEMIEIFDALSDREDVRAVILTGAGNVFSAGADIKERAGGAGKEQPGAYLRLNRITREFFYAITDCAKPVIAAVNGAAIGAGYAMMACADIIIASDNAYVRMPELDVGLAGGAKFLTQHFARSKARMMFFTGQNVPAEELYRLGVVEKVTTREQLLPAAMDIARQIAAKSPLAVRKAKMAFNAVEEMPDRDGYRFEQCVTIELSYSEDAAEAQRAFVEKRPPVFRGR